MFFFHGVDYDPIQLVLGGEWLVQGDKMNVKGFTATILVTLGMVSGGGAVLAWLGWSALFTPSLPRSLAVEMRPPQAQQVDSQPSADNPKPMLALVKSAPPPKKTPAKMAVSPRPASAKQPENQPESQVVPRLAVVIDDIGFNLKRDQRFMQMNIPITFSVIPGLSHSRASARLIRDSGHDLLVHLPMEPFDYPRQNPGPNPLMLHQGQSVIRERMTAYLEELPGAVGASNHMGSAYTFDPVRMGIVQGMVHKKKLFFLNSRTSTSPVPSSIARANGYAYLQRDVFLDHKVSESAIRSELRRAIALARKKGSAVAIGHPHPETFRVLQRDLVQRAPKGMKLVRLSQLLSSN